MLIYIKGSHEGEQLSVPFLQGRGDPDPVAPQLDFPRQKPSNPEEDKRRM
jgi:hypothetical protein